jgi:outer membrane receptor protein involved in Fe transport
MALACVPPRLQASASLNNSEWLSLSIDAFNLTDATRAEYENDPMLPRRLDYDGRTYRATLRADFQSARNGSSG